MNCSDCGLGLGYFGHWPGLIIILLIVAGFVLLFIRLAGNITSRPGGRLSNRNNFIHPGRGDKCPDCHAPIENAYLCCPECNHQLKKNCTSCGKIIKTSWKVCPYCETNL